MSFNNQNESLNSSSSSQYHTASENDGLIWQPDEFLTSTQASTVSEYHTAVSSTESDCSPYTIHLESSHESQLGNNSSAQINDTSGSQYNYGNAYEPNSMCDYSYNIELISRSDQYNMIAYRTEVVRETYIGDTSFESHSSQQISYESDLSFNSNVNNSTFWDTTQDS